MWHLFLVTICSFSHWSTWKQNHVFWLNWEARVHSVRYIIRFYLCHKCIVFFMLRISWILFLERQTVIIYDTFWHSLKHQGWCGQCSYRLLCGFTANFMLFYRSYLTRARQGSILHTTATQSVPFLRNCESALLAAPVWGWCHTLASQGKCFQIILQC